MIGYRKIFTQAWDLTWNNKFLVIFGLFLTLGNFSYNFDKDSTPVQISSTGAVIIIIVSLLLLALYFRAKAGLIISVKAVLDKQETSFGKAFSFSRLFFNRLFGIYFSVNFAFVFITAIIASPIVFLFTHHYLNRAIILSAFGLLIILPVAALVVLINILSPLFVVLFDLKAKEAIGRTFELVAKHWPTLIGFGLLLFLLEIVAIVLMSPIVFLGKFPYHMGIVALILGGTVSLILQSLIAVFSQAAWVLIFLQLVKPQKFEDEEPVPVPEIAGG